MFTELLLISNFGTNVRIGGRCIFAIVLYECEIDRIIFPEY